MTTKADIVPIRDHIDLKSLDKLRGDDAKDKSILILEALEVGITKPAKIMKHINKHHPGNLVAIEDIYFLTRTQSFKEALQEMILWKTAEFRLERTELQSRAVRELLEQVKAGTLDDNKILLELVKIQGMPAPTSTVNINSEAEMQVTISDKLGMQ